MIDEERHVLLTVERGFDDAGRKFWYPVVEEYVNTGARAFERRPVLDGSRTFTAYRREDLGAVLLVLDEVLDSLGFVVNFGRGAYELIAKCRRDPRCWR